MQPELRKDPILHRYVLIAPQPEGKAPEVHREEPLSHGPAKACDFCPEQVNKRQAVLTMGPKSRWYTKVIKHTNPVLRKNNPKAYGFQEVIIETPNHIVEFEDLPEEHIAKILEAYSTRIRELSKDEHIDYIYLAKRQGGRARSTLMHSHSDLFATAFLPPEQQELSQSCKAYRLQHKACPHCDLIIKEQKSKRLIFENEHIIAFAPFASINHYEVSILPKRHVHSLTNLKKPELESLAGLLKQLLRQISQLQLPYQFHLHELVHDKDIHFAMYLSPVGNLWGNMDLESGIIINPVSPEDAAKYYREGL